MIISFACLKELNILIVLFADFQLVAARSRDNEEPCKPSLDLSQHDWRPRSPNKAEQKTSERAFALA